MKTLSTLKKPFGKATFSKIVHVKYLGWEDAFEVEFADGLCFLEDHHKIKKANRLAGKEIPLGVHADKLTGSHFIIEYESGKKVEVSWEAIRETPKNKSKKLSS